MSADVLGMELLGADLLDRRVLGAVRFEDAASGAAVGDALLLDAPVPPGFPLGTRPARWRRTRRGWYALAEAPGFEAHATSFDAPPAAPAPAPLAFTVRDPAGRWLPRRAAITVPRDPDPAHQAEADSLFAPVTVRLFPAPAATPGAGAAVVRGAVRGVAPADPPLAGALVRVRRRGDPDDAEHRLGWGVSDARGEVLVAVYGLPTAGLADGPVPTGDAAVTLDVVWDPAAGPASASGPVPDPDALEAGRAALRVRSVDATLAPGRRVTLAL